jgi:O-antigen/teichoic acid export membrane protein
MNIRDALRRLKDSSYWRDIAWLASGNAAAQGIAVVAMPLLTRLYTPADFALQTLFLQVLGFAVVLLTCRFEYFVQLPKQDSDATGLLLLVLSMGVGGSAVATPLFWIFRQTLANWIGTPTLTAWLALVPLTAALMSFSIAVQNFAQRRGQYRLSSASEIVNKASFVGAALAGFWAFKAPAGLMLASAAGAVGKIVWLSRLPRSRSSTRLRLIDLFDQLETGKLGAVRRVAGTYSRLSGSVVISHLLLACTTLIPSIFIVRAYGTESLGQFALASTTLFLPAGLIGNAIGQVYYQRAAERRAARQDFGDLWRATATRLLIVGLPVYGLFALVSRWAYPLIFGPSWVDAGRFASLLSISAFFSFITSPLDRGCLVVRAWAYIPLWHAARVLSTGAVAWVAWRKGWNVEVFVVALVAQMSILYLTDYWAEYRFAIRGALKRAT